MNNTSTSLLEQPPARRTSTDVAFDDRAAKLRA